MTRVLHVIAEFSKREAMGRTVAETVQRVPGEHHLVTARAHDGHALFRGVHELGGRTVFLLPLFHPATGLRTPRVAEQLREDFARIPDLLAQPLPEGPAPLVTRDEREPEPDQMGLFG